MVEVGDKFVWHGVRITVTEVQNPEWAMIHCVVRRVEVRPWAPDDPHVQITEWDKQQHFPNGSPPDLEWVKVNGFDSE